jgi:hypothetical protein
MECTRPASPPQFSSMIPIQAAGKMEGSVLDQSIIDSQTGEKKHRKPKISEVESLKMAQSGIFRSPDNKK